MFKNCFHSLYFRVKTHDAKIVYQRLTIRLYMSILATSRAADYSNGKSVCRLFVKNGGAFVAGYA